MGQKRDWPTVEGEAPGWAGNPQSLYCPRQPVSHVSAAGDVSSDGP